MTPDDCKALNLATTIQLAIDEPDEGELLTQSEASRLWADLFILGLVACDLKVVKTVARTLMALEAIERGER